MEDEEKRGEKRAADDGQQEMPEDQKKRCSNMINELKKRKHEHLTWAFKAPVDPSVWGCRDYYDVVKTPMDMSTYEHKFITNQYQHEDQLAADIRLMFSNCYLYNPPDNPVHQSCQKLEMLFDSYWAKLRADGQEHRPRKKLKMINTQGTKKDPGSHVASSAGTYH
jgi:bromodomain-containing factor 1